MNTFTAYIFTMVIGLLSFSFGIYIGYLIYSQSHEGFAAYERGAHAVVQHHINFGGYGSKIYREAAFTWGDPQTKEDVEEIRKIAHENACEEMRMQNFPDIFLKDCK